MKTADDMISEMEKKGEREDTKGREESLDEALAVQVNEICIWYEKWDEKERGEREDVKEKEEKNRKKRERGIPSVRKREREKDKGRKTNRRAERRNTRRERQGRERPRGREEGSGEESGREMLQCSHLWYSSPRLSCPSSRWCRRISTWGECSALCWGS